MHRLSRSNCSRPGVAERHLPIIARRLLVLLLSALPIFAKGDLLAADEPASAAKRPLRIVCLGDSITDGHTYPLLVQQALRAAGRPVPVMLNAGIGGDTAAGMLTRLDRDVFSRQPDLVLLSVGINDFGGRVALDDFQQRVSQIIDQTLARKIDVLLLTTTGVRDAGSQSGLDRWNAALRQLAEQKRIRIADVAAAFAPAQAAGENLWEPDGCHLNFAGYRRLTRAVLNGLGESGVAVPEAQQIDAEPGLIRNWRMRQRPTTVRSMQRPLPRCRPTTVGKIYRCPNRSCTNLGGGIRSGSAGLPSASRTRSAAANASKALPMSTRRNGVTLSCGRAATSTRPGSTANRSTKSRVKAGTSGPRCPSRSQRATTR